MSAVTRRHGPGLLGMSAVTVLGVAVLGALALPTLANSINAGRLSLRNPASAVFHGDPWTPAHTFVVVVVGVVLVGLIVVLAYSASHRDWCEHDNAAQFMGRGKQIAALLPAAVRAKTKRMGLNPNEFRGFYVGSTVSGSQELYADYEATITVIAGPRRNKSVSLVIPNLLRHPATAVATSVKPDVVDATIHFRATLGRVHLVDPQGLAPAYSQYHAWYNPLKAVTTFETATELANVLATAEYGTPDPGDPNKWFADEGKKLLAGYILAAARGRLYLPVVYEWMGRDNDLRPIRALENSDPIVADMLRAYQQTTEKTRSGFFSYARGAVSFLVSEHLASWVRPSPGRDEFDPAAFARADADTLYLLSTDSGMTAGPLVAAVTFAVLEAAATDAEHRPGGRRARPMLAALDEAGNICKIPDLPARYTHYGSRAINIMSILQSQAQGAGVWGREGFQQLWDSSTVQIFGGGNASNEFRRDLSEDIGDYEYGERSESYRSGERSTSHTRHSERIMDPSDLRSLRLGRMVVFASGCRAVLVRSVPFFKNKQLLQRSSIKPDQVQNFVQLEAESVVA